MTKNSTGKQIDFREGHKYKSLAHHMAGEDSRVRRIDTSSTDDEIRTNVHKSQDYHAKFIDAIQVELEDEMSQVETRLKTWNKKRLLAHGVSLFQLKARSAGWMYGQRLLRLTIDGGGPLPSHRFKHGDIVLLSRTDPLGKEAVEAVVASRSRTSIRLAMNNLPKRHRQGHWRLDRGANRIAHDRMRDALNSFLSDENSTDLSSLLLGQVRDIEDARKTPHRIKGIISNEFKNSTQLNEAQNQAVSKAMKQRLSLIQGPPGTGKTYTAVRILEGWVKNSNTPILAVAESNVAVDNLLEGLLNLRINAVRLGQPVKVRESLREATIDAKMEVHRLRKDLDVILELNEDLSRRIPGMKGKDKGLAHRDLKKGWKDARKIEQQMKDDILDNADVICATCIGSGHLLLDGRRFPRVLIDEATQATEPATLVPIVRGCKQLVLVGDHKQLPPTVISSRAEKMGLNISLFERLIQLGVNSTMLLEQYRMHPCIAEFPSIQSYEGLLKNAISEDKRPTPIGLIWPDFENPVAFLPVEGGEIVSQDGHSKANPTEAGWVLKMVESILQGQDISPHEIGIITPYNGQVRAIRDLMESSGGMENGGKWEGIEVRSVDGYQGREKELIILSAVRSNPEGNVGFLDDSRRLNVALTRAKRGLVVIGDPKTLRNQRDWDFWLTWAEEKNLIAWHLLQM
jgi:superfamily I DNA and/or RNA helicase